MLASFSAKLSDVKPYVRAVQTENFFEANLGILALNRLKYSLLNTV